MAEDRKRTYQSVTSLPTLRTNIGVPPLKMVLVGGDKEAAAPESQSPEATHSTESPASKERVVRKIIAHLEKDA